MGAVALFLITLLGLSAPTLAQEETHAGEVALRLGTEVGCEGLIGQIQVGAGRWAGGSEVSLCKSVLSWNFLVTYRPIAGLELSLQAGGLGGTLTLGIRTSYRVPIGSLGTWQFGVLPSATMGLAFLPIGKEVPFLQLGLFAEASLPMNLTLSAQGSQASGGTEGAVCYEATVETLQRTFWGLAESTRSAVLTSLSVLYADFSIEIDNLTFNVNGAQGSVQGTYRVGATHRLTGKRVTYAGQGSALFQHDGCTWRLVSYRY